MLGGLPFAPKPMCVELPWPDAKLNPNRSKGVHWAITSSLRKKAKNDAFWLTRGAMLQTILEGASYPDCKTISLVITFAQPDKRARDRDNLLAALKPSLDGLAEAMGVNDSKFDPITIRREYGAKPGRVIVEVSHAV